jgi:hypothetical protein
MVFYSGRPVLLEQFNTAILNRKIIVLSCQNNMQSHEYSLLTPLTSLPDNYSTTFDILKNNRMYNETFYW